MSAVQALVVGNGSGMFKAGFARDDAPRAVSIYVPQGYGAKLTRATESYNISGLFTDGFSSCNIVAGFGKDSFGNGKSILMHVDIQTVSSVAQIEQIQGQVKWLGDDSKVILYYRENDGGGVSGEFVRIEIINLLKGIVEPNSIPLTREYDGIYVALPKQNEPLDNQIKLFKIHDRPENLIHHPKEQLCEAIQKITQIIGYKEKCLTGQAKRKQFNLFDGQAWEPLKDDELTIDTTKEIESFSSSDNYWSILQKLTKIIVGNSKYTQLGQSSDSFARGVVPYMEGYLNGFDCKLLLKRNLKDIFDCTEAFVKKLKLTCESEEGLEEYISSTKPDPMTEFRSLVIECFKHYQERKYYDDLKIEYTKVKREARDNYVRGRENYKDSKYEIAASFFRESVKSLTICCLKNDRELATAYYNCGRSLAMNEEYTEALMFLETSYLLRKNYASSEPDKLKKTTEAYEKVKEKSNSKIRPIMDVSRA